MTNGSVVCGAPLRMEDNRFVLVKSADGAILYVPWRLLGRRDRTALAEASQASPEGWTLGRSGSGISFGTRLERAERRRKAWLKRGGTLVGYEVRAGAVYLKLHQATGGGAQGAVRLHVIGLSLPDPDHGSGWSGWSIGAGADFAYFHIATGGSGTDAGVVEIPGTLTYYAGFGGFQDDSHWKGVVLGLRYSPSVVIPIGSPSSVKPAVNYVGTELTLDFTTLEAAMKNAAQEAHVRFYAFALPPVADLPLLLAIGGGAVWY